MTRKVSVQIKSTKFRRNPRKRRNHDVRSREVSRMTQRISISRSRKRPKRERPNRKRHIAKFTEQMTKIGKLNANARNQINISQLNS